MKIYNHYSILLLIIALGSYSCNKEQIDERPIFNLETPDLISDEDYEIYSLVINEFSHGWVVIDQSTLTNLDFSDSSFIDVHFFEDNPEFNVDLFDTLNLICESTVQLGANFISDRIEIVLVSSKELSYIFDNKGYKEGWQEFYQEYMGDLCRCTQIAYNANRTQSILEYEVSDYFSSGKYFIYLIKQNDIWVIKDYRVE